MRRIAPTCRADRKVDAPAEAGSALVMVVFVLALVGSMGVALLMLTQNEASMGRADVRAKQAFFLAEAGLEDGRRTLYLANGSGTFDDDLIAAAGADDIMDFEPDGFTLIRDAGGKIIGVGGVGDDVPLSPPTSFGQDKDVQGLYLSFLTNDPVDLPASPTADTNKRVMITGIGVLDGATVETARAIVEMIELMPSLPPAAITLLGPTPNFLGPDNTASAFLGEDCGGAGQPNLYVPTVGVVGAAAEASAELGWSDKPNYESGPHSGTDTIVDLTNPGASPLVLAPLDPGWQDCQTILDMVENLRAQADVICAHGTDTGSTCAIPGGTNLIIFGDGDLEIDKDTTVGGLLIVTGTLRRQGGHSWNGLIMAIGEGTYETSGGGNCVTSGALLVADIAGPDGIYGNGDDCTGGPAGDGFGIADYLANGGGNSTAQYCTTDIIASEPHEEFYPVVEFLQR